MRIPAEDSVAVGVTSSSPRGADGNVEFFFHCRKAGAAVDDAVLDAVVAAANAEEGA